MLLTSRIRLLLIDDHPVLREGLANLLERQPDFQIVGQAGTGEEALRLLKGCQPDICLLDLSLPGIDGFETLRRMRSQHPATRVLVLTSSDSSSDADQAVQDGACGFISKNIDHREIVTAVRDAHRGMTGIRKGVESSRGSNMRALLTQRETDVLSLMRRGLTNAEIGRQLAIAERTVKGHVTEILLKLDAKDRAGAVARGFDLGLLKASPRSGE